jgi:hypothetical protein
VSEWRDRGDWRRVVVAGVVVIGGVACGGAGCPERAAAVSRQPRIAAPSLFSMPERPTCSGAVGDAADLGVVDDAARVEVSGLAASLQTPGLVWLVADSDSVVFAVEAAGKSAGAIRARVRLPRPLVDPEDLALGPCPDLSGPCVFVADTGDNERERADVAVVAFPEPQFTTTPEGGVAPAAVDIALDAVWTMRFVYPDNEAVDVEALAVLPDASALLLFEKTAEPEARIFVAPAPWTLQTPADGDDDNDRPVPLRGGGAVVIPTDADGDGDDDTKLRRITAADVHWSGTRLLLRTTGGIFEYARPALDSGVDGSVSGAGRGGLVGGGFGDLRGVAPIRQVPSPADEAQGEAIGWTDDGLAWISISEVKKKKAAAGERPVLHRLDCRP